MVAKAWGIGVMWFEMTPCVFVIDVTALLGPETLRDVDGIDVVDMMIDEGNGGDGDGGGRKSDNQISRLGSDPQKERVT